MEQWLRDIKTIGRWGTIAVGSFIPSLISNCNYKINTDIFNHLEIVFSPMFYQTDTKTALFQGTWLIIV